MLFSVLFSVLGLVILASITFIQNAEPIEEPIERNRHVNLETSAPHLYPTRVLTLNSVKPEPVYTLTLYFTPHPTPTHPKAVIKVAPALAAGCTVVLKVSHATCTAHGL